MIDMLQWLFVEAVDVQRDIYLSFAERIKLYASTGQWSHLALFLPIGVLFGIIHALTPGHSKTVLAAYTAATPGGIGKSVTTAFILSAVHISMSVAIILLSLPLISSVLGSVGRAPLLENLSRILMGGVGIWMIWAALQTKHVHASNSENRLFAVFAGLIPCPLTFFIMTFAITRGVVEAGLAFAVMMLIGVFITLGSLAVFVTVAKQTFSKFINNHGSVVSKLSVSLQVLVGIGFIILAIATASNQNDGIIF